MTDYTTGLTRPLRLRISDVTVGQPVTVHISEDREFPGVVLPHDPAHRGIHVRLEGGEEQVYRQGQVFPREVAHRRWRAVFEDRWNGGETAYTVSARTDLEARESAGMYLIAQLGESAVSRYIFRSITREG